MTTPEIQSFLAVCRCKTVTRAAEQLFISQSSLSTRLRTLERELGDTLFYRRKGSREMVLTATGKAFYELAVQYEAIVNQMEQLCQKQPLMLRVSALNSVGNYLLPDAFEAFLREHPDAELEIQNLELAPACRSISRGLTDLAFATGAGAEPGTEACPVCREPMVLICAASAPYEGPVSLRELPLRSEVYSPWCASFVQWHQSVFGLGAQPQVSISLMEQLSQFMKWEGSWAIVPASVAAGMERAAHVRRVETAEPLPDREIFCIMAKGNRNPAIPYFLACLKTALESMPQTEIRFPMAP